MRHDSTIPVASYRFWRWWFREHEEKARELKGYKWPQPLDEWKTMLNGRPCPFCQGKQIFLLPEEMVLNDMRIIEGYCVCVVLRLMEEKHKYESPHRIALLRDLHPIEPYVDNINEIKSFTTSFITQPSLWCYLSGGFGSGKTHVLSAAKNALRGLALYITTSDLSQMVFKATADHNLDELIHEVSTAPILLLDDLGTEHASDYLYSAIYAIINARYELRELAPTFITSNYTQQDLAGFQNENM